MALVLNEQFIAEGESRKTSSYIEIQTLITSVTIGDEITCQCVFVWRCELSPFVGMLRDIVALTPSRAVLRIITMG